MAGPLGFSGGNFAVAPIPISLAGAEAYLIPSGQWRVDLGKYTTIEWFDDNTGNWREAAQLAGGMPFDSDGTNYRLINRTGTPVGAIITNFGSSYTSTPTVAVSAGGSVWRAIVGGAINTSVTVTSGGSYNYIPTILFPPPAAGGYPATATAAISGGSISSITVTNQGAGYTVAPSGTIAIPASQAQNYLGTNQGNNVLVIADPRETASGSAPTLLSVNSTLVGAQTVRAVVCTDPGTAAQTSLPTLTFSGGGGGGAAATVIMNWAATGFTVSANGSSYGATQPFIVIGAGLLNQSTDAAETNPELNLQLTKPRNFQFEGKTTSVGGINPSASVGAFDDQGWGIQRVPDAIIFPGGGAVPTIGATATVTVGAVTDTSYLQMLKV